MSSASAPSSSFAAKTITSVDEFKAIFQAPVDGLLLCYETPTDAVNAVDLSAFESSVRQIATRENAKLHLYFWNCTSAQFGSAKRQLEKKAGELLVLIVYKGEVADALRARRLDDLLAEDLPRVCKRLASFQQTRGAAAVVATAAAPRMLQVDVAKLVGMGKKLMTEGQPLYAEKFFQKAVDALDALRPQVELTNTAAEAADYEGSVATCLAWVGLAQLVQGGSAQHNASLARLAAAPQWEPYRREPLGDVSRVLTAQVLLAAAPRPWSSDTCSEAKLSAALQQEPGDHAARSLLVVTLFLRGDLERALTEAVKLNALHVPYGLVALRKLSAFLGESHVLVQRLGPLAP
ncbi:hypothetical protein STCU_04526 [Strigomonas culicis]|uniref:Uncharacterized protein n=1 Tax=Strigomonas culicis TaxID=28005 RepID=S9W0N2_9TRYP|nr:hypothetical protein STCU_08007 [Strigomonas culicis]EPY29495.1 hypothetical protein STCU_04526 [Strigomonas culicis]|eukprot:EPY22952.1 hypothetical protein STCU_08007 [Strigomonas culicis]